VVAQGPYHCGCKRGRVRLRLVHFLTARILAPLRSHPLLALLVGGGASERRRDEPPSPLRPPPRPKEPRMGHITRRGASTYARRLENFSLKRDVVSGEQKRRHYEVGFQPGTAHQPLHIVAADAFTGHQKWLSGQPKFTRSVLV
jgi:hypothetical protein